MYLCISSSSIKHVDISEYLWVSSLGKLFGPACQGSLDSFAEAFHLVITKSQPHHPCYNKSFCIMLSSPLPRMSPGKAPHITLGTPTFTGALPLFTCHRQVRLNIKQHLTPPCSPTVMLSVVEKHVILVAALRMTWFQILHLRSRQSSIESTYFIYGSLIQSVICYH